MNKKVKIRRTLFILIAIGIILVVLYFLFNPKKAINLILPDLSEISYVHIDLKKDSALVKLFVLVQNKMPYKMVIDTLHFDFKLNDHRIVDETIPVLINQSRFDTDTIELPIHVSVTNIKKRISDLQSQDSIELDANFYLVYNTIVGRKKIHFNKKIKIARPVPPQLKILKVEYIKYNFRDKASDAVIKLEIINNGKAIDLQISDLNYTFQIKNTLSSQGIYPTTINVLPGSSVIVEIPIVLEFSHPFKMVWKILQDKDESKFELKLKADVTFNNLDGIKSIPFEVSANGMMELVK